MSRLARRAPLALSFLLIVSCGGGATPGSCATGADCPTGMRCVDRMCVAGSDGGADAGTDAGPTCTAGQVLRVTGCESDCGDPAAIACAGGDECDYATGACVPAGTAVLTGAPQTCGTQSCLPGTECSVAGECEPAAPCFSMRCEGEACWGRSCVSARPAGACTPAPLERMNMDDFLRGGRDGGAFDLEFDDACNAYIVTMISGTDYLRQLEPDGTVTTWNGVTNLNMGEVAVRRLPGGEFGMGDGLGQVGLTYICCATCGCVGSDPQGVARLDRMGSASLPMVIIATPSPGDGPFGLPALDTGPYGLTWGRDNKLYVGNVTAQGDLVEADLDLGSTREVQVLPARIHASATFGAHSLLIAVEGGTIHRVDLSTDARDVFAEAGEDVTSLLRDPFTGHVFVSVASARILEYDSQGNMLGVFAEPGERGRLAYAPDGYLYYLIAGWPTAPQILRYELPHTR